MVDRRGTLDQRHQPALNIGIAVDVSLGRLNRPVASKNLNVPEGPACLVDLPRGTGDECPAARMGRAPRQPKMPIRGGEPVDDGRWGEAAAAFGIDNISDAVAYFSPPRQPFPQIVV